MTMPESDDARPPTGTDAASTRRREVVGSRAWFWALRFKHAALFAAPVPPVADAVANFVRPHLRHRLSGAEAARVDHAYAHQGGATGGRATSVVVNLHHPHLAQRLTAAAPGLVVGAALALISYALWRVAVNIAAGRREFTPRDETYMNRALWGFNIAFVVVLICCAAVPQFTDALSTLDPTWGLMAVLVLMGGVHQVYLRARHAYDGLTEARKELEGVV